MDSRCIMSPERRNIFIVNLLPAPVSGSRSAASDSVKTLQASFFRKRLKIPGEI